MVSDGVRHVIFGMLFLIFYYLDSDATDRWGQACYFCMLFLIFYYLDSDAVGSDVIKLK
jgi:hypothetical protein